MTTNTNTVIAEYAAPESLEDTLQAIADGEATILAGGTDLMVRRNTGVPLNGNRLVNITRIKGLSGVAEEDGRIRIGATTTVSDILGNELLMEKAAVLPEAANCFASGQIRNAATLAGNICNASPAGDMIIPLFVLDAEIELASWKSGVVSSRTLPLDTFFTGPGQTQIAANELLTAISFAVPDAAFEARFLKSGPRPALEISTVSAGFGASIVDGVLSNARVALGAVGSTPIRARKAEEFLEGKTLDDAVIEEAAEIAAGEATPIDDIRATAWYRDHLIKVFLRRLLSNDA